MNDLHSAHRNAVTYVSGDRKKEGIFSNLSIFENLLLSVYQDYRLGGWLNLVDRRKLQPVFEWESGRLAVRMGNQDNLITSLSGGNQQKVLIARAFAEKPNVLALNDPARGIDVGAKLDSIGTCGTSPLKAKPSLSSPAKSRNFSTSARACSYSATARSLRHLPRPLTAT